MSSPAPGPTNPPHNDRMIVAVAWAIAAIVVAIVAGFIAWLALGDRGSPPGAGDAPAATAPADAGAPPEDETPGDDASEDQPRAGSEGQAHDTAPGDTPPGEELAEQTPPPEVAEMMLDLQRRDADDDMAVGAVDAPVVMIEYADYRCPYCAQFHLQTRPELMPHVDEGTLRIEFRDFVLFDETSHLAAVASRAAAAQGHLEDYQHAVFELSAGGHGDYGREDLIALAEEVGVPDLEAFEAALEDEEIVAQVDTDTAEARTIGATSTPTFIINTQVVQGAQPAPVLAHIIEREAERAAEQAPTG